MALNPLIFKLFKWQHFVLFFIGFAASFINARAILPFMLVCLLDLDYSKLEKKDKTAMLIFTFLAIFIMLAFGSASYVGNP
jgi:hypothetical protein